MNMKESLKESVFTNDLVKFKNILQKGHHTDRLLNESLHYAIVLGRNDMSCVLLDALDSPLTDKQLDELIEASLRSFNSAMLQILMNFGAKMTHRHVELANVVHVSILQMAKRNACMGLNDLKIYNTISKKRRHKLSLLERTLLQKWLSNQLCIIDGILNHHNYKIPCEHSSVESSAPGLALQLL